MAPVRRSRFAANLQTNLEKLQTEAKKSLSEVHEPIKDRRDVARKTEYEKGRVWRAWLE